MKNIFFAATVFLLSACASTPPQYFPGTAFAGDPDPFYAELYETLLERMREPSLSVMSETDTGQTIYRLTIAHYARTPIHTIRLERSSDGFGNATIKVMDAGWGVNGRRTLETTRFRRVSKDAMASLKTGLDASGFWDKEYSYSDDICMHATYFLFEAAENGKYHAVNEDACSAGTSMGRLVLKFYDLAGMTDAEDWPLNEYFARVKDAD